jgi:hypothetical protein
MRKKIKLLLKLIVLLIFLNKLLFDIFIDLFFTENNNVIDTLRIFRQKKVYLFFINKCKKKLPIQKFLIFNKKFFDMEKLID